MRRLFIFVILLASGCGTSPNPDADAARGLVRGLHPDAEIDLVDGPEYTAVPKIPKHGPGDTSPDRPAAGGVRVRFLYRDGDRTTRDDWMIWVSGDHKAIDWSGNPDGDDWRRYLRSLAKEKE
jgi:hypothetical protein